MDNTYSSVFPPVPSTGPGTLPAAQPRAQQAQPPHVQGRQHPPVDQTKLEQRSVAPVDPSPPDSAASEPGGQLPTATAVPRPSLNMSIPGAHRLWHMWSLGQVGKGERFEPVYHRYQDYLDIKGALDDLKYNLNEL